MKGLPQVWITGIGAATPIGHDYAAIADNLLGGRSGIRPVAGFDASQHPSRIAGQVLDMPVPRRFDARDFVACSRMEQLAVWCTAAALEDSGLWDRRDSLRIGLILGIGSEWMMKWEAAAFQQGRPVFSPEQEAEGLVQRTARWLGLRGPAASLSAACASGNYAIALARRWIQLGWVDCCLAGGCDPAVTPMSLAGFGNLRALTRNNDNPTTASRPFDRDRDGFVIAEGGTVLLLEPAATARRRGSKAYAVVAGCGASSDAHHMVIPCPDPTPAAECMRRALADAELPPGDLDYVNAHATSTPVGDVCEARVLHAALGDAVRTVPVSSTKSMTGHLLTAAAAIEALACIVALEHQALPPTINLDDPDPECNLCHVAHQAQPRRVRAAASNSFGFGGSNTCLVLRKVA